MIAPLVIARESPQQPEVLQLIAELDAYMSGLYPAESNHLLSIEALCTPDVRFFVARLAGAAVGCGALRLDGEGWGELKRMYVRPEARGRKIGRELLARIEAQAAGEGVAVLRLETGISQPEALGLYRVCGYEERGPFGAYGPDPLSVFMEKRLR